MKSYEDLTGADKDALVEIHLFVEKMRQLGIATPLAPSFRQAILLLGLSSHGSFSYRIGRLKRAGLIISGEDIMKKMIKAYGLE
ncbi:MAG: hypothetical protein DRI46_07975, partial [Chloroflexi bacterium]